MEEDKKTKEEKEEEKRQLLEKYKDDDTVICVEDGDELIVAPKFTDEDWKKVDQMIDQHPLFSKNTGDIGNNELLQALQAIKYDESAEKILENLYKEGNEVMKQKLLGKDDKKKFFIKKCLEIYSDALAQSADNKMLRAKVLSNRALLHMWMKNFRSAIEDALAAMQLDEKLIKPYVRCAESLLKLGMYEKGVKIADKGLLIENNKELQAIREECYKKFEKEAAASSARKSRIDNDMQKLLDVLKDKKLVLGECSDFPLPTVYNVHHHVTHSDASSMETTTYHIPSCSSILNSVSSIISKLLLVLLLSGTAGLKSLKVVCLGTTTSSILISPISSSSYA